MSARDELAKVIADNCIVIQDANYGYMSATTLTPDGMADDILAAGYRKPRTITTAEELDALPFEAVLRDFDGHVLERWGQPKENLWATVMVTSYIPRLDISLPATVLFDPEASK